jgi:hypothetical protein
MPNARKMVPLERAVAAEANLTRSPLNRPQIDALQSETCMMFPRQRRKPAGLAEAVAKSWTAVVCALQPIFRWLPIRIMRLLSHQEGHRPANRAQRRKEMRGKTDLY